MAQNLKTSQEPLANTLTGYELVRGVQGGNNVQLTARSIASHKGKPYNPIVSTPPANGDVVFGNTGTANTSSSNFVQADSYSFTANDVGKTIWIYGGGTNGGTLKTTIASQINSTAITLASGVVCNVGGANAYCSGAGIANTGKGWVPGDTITFTSGTYALAANLTVTTTQVSGATVNAGGADGYAGSNVTGSGANGNVNVYGTTGVGTPFVANVALLSGAISSINSILLGGSYTTNPTTLTAEPVTGANLVGATLDITMGIASASIPVPGSYQALPTNPVTPSSTSGTGTGGTFTLSFTNTGPYFYGTSDNTAIANTSSPLLLEISKTYFTTLNTTGSPYLPKKASGGGQIVDVNGQRRAPYFSIISGAPANTGSWSGDFGAWNGDLSAVQFAIEHTISGAATLGEPSTGYSYTEEAYPFIAFMTNYSGWNQNTGNNTGRTSANFSRIHVANYGQGDCMAFNATGFVGNTKSGATSFLANPAVTLFGGDTFAGVDGVYLNPCELDCNDQGHDVAAIGYVFNANRTNNKGGLGAIWFGFRSQTQGTVEIDAHFTAAGQTKIGLDLTGISFPTSGIYSTNSAIAMVANHKIFLNATAAASQPGYASSTGTTYIYYSSTNSGIQGIVGNSPSFLFTSSQTFLYGNTTIGTSLSNRIQANGAANGSAVTIAATGATDANVNIGLWPKGNGMIQFMNANNMVAPGAVACALGTSGPTGANTAPQKWLAVQDSGGNTHYIPCF